MFENRDGSMFRTEWLGEILKIHRFRIRNCMSSLVCDTLKSWQCNWETANVELLKYIDYKTVTAWSLRYMLMKKNYTCVRHGIYIWTARKSILHNTRIKEQQILNIPCLAVANSVEPWDLIHWGSNCLKSRHIDELKMDNKTVMPDYMYGKLVLMPSSKLQWPCKV